MPVTLTLSPSLSSTLPNATSAVADQTQRTAQCSVPGSTVDSFDLLQGQKTVAITHNGLIYRLQATRLGKLILTK